MKTNQLFGKTHRTSKSSGLCWAGLLGLILLTSGLVGKTVAQPPFTPLPPEQETEDEESEAPLVVRPPGNRTPPSSFRPPTDRSDVADQIVELRDKFAGWQGVKVVAERATLSNELRANWVMVDANGRFDGRVTAGQDAEIEDMTVYLLHMGRLVKETHLDKTGGFVFTNVRQGAYGLVGWGSNGFFAFGLNVVEYNPDAPATTPRSVWPMAFQNKSTINTDWVQYFAPSIEFRIYGRYPHGEGQDDPASLYGYDGVSKFLPKATPATTVSGHPVRLTADGRLIGRIHQLTTDTGRPVDLRNTQVMLFDGDDVLAATDTDNFGMFEFADVPEGKLGLAAAGVDGMGLIGIDVGKHEKSIMNEEGEFIQKQDQTVDEFVDFCILPSEATGWLNNYAKELAYRRNLLAPRRPLDDENQVCNACAGAGCSHCQGTGRLCTSRCQTFEDWAHSCCHQRERTRLGSGYIISEAAKDIRRGVDRTGNLFEKAFYGEGGFQGTGGGLGSSGNYSEGYYNNGRYGDASLPPPLP